MKTMTFRDDVVVTKLRVAGNDTDVIAAARVSTIGDDSLNWLDADLQAGDEGLLRYLMKNRHGSPFEHAYLKFFVDAPIAVFREFHRHRIGFSYNETSGRYRELDPVFYVPNKDRNLLQVGKPGHYTFRPGSELDVLTVELALKRSYRAAWGEYQTMIRAGIAKEVARYGLPVGIYSQMHVSCNPRSLMNFLSLRVASADSVYPSSPMREIEMAAEQMEMTFAEHFPVTYAAFVAAGRVAP